MYAGLMSPHSTAIPLTGLVEDACGPLRLVSAASGLNRKPLNLNHQAGECCLRASDLVRVSLGEIHLNLYLNVYAAVNSWRGLFAGAEVQNTAFYTMMGLDRNCSDADVKRQIFFESPRYSCFR
jgi:hypothetical protein